MIQILAMHGWAGDSRGWAALAAAAAARGWGFTAADRGYGPGPARPAAWPAAPGRRLLITHSMGPLLLSEAVLAGAEALVLLAGFARFVPAGAAGRPLQVALAGMDAALAAGPAAAAAMLEQFLAEVAAPDPVSALPATILEQPLRPAALELLRADLQLLASATGLPAALPRQVPTLCVEAGADRIVVPAARASLQQALPQAQRLHLPGAGHALLSGPLLPSLLAWIEALPC